MFADTARRSIALATLCLLLPLPALASDEKAETGEGTVIVPHDDGAFGPDPEYPDAYDGSAQQAIYGDKSAITTQRPLLEVGRELYGWGPFRPAPTFLGEANPTSPQFLLFGDFRTAVAYNDNGGAAAGGEVALWVPQLNLDADLKLTATERFHAFFRPLEENQEKTRCEFAGNDARDDNNNGQRNTNRDCEFEWDPEPLAYFFEGDLGAMFGGMTGNPSPFDLPVTGGKIPLLFQNGIWVEDAFKGGAFSIPARNSKTLDISNFDVTFFAGVDDVTSGALENKVDGNDGHIYGVTAFLEALEGYFEVGYGYTYDQANNCDRDYHNITGAFTRRYGGWLSNSIRVIGNVGQDAEDFEDGAVAALECQMVLDAGETADGYAILIENSFVTRKPSHVVPYLNLFFGADQPQPLARENAGLLKNTGILFDTDALTGFPKMDDTAANTTGGALGLEILGPSFNWQLVFELAYARKHTDPAPIRQQIGAGIRAQLPITNALLLRVNAMYALVDNLCCDNDDDLRGATFEIRYKF